MKCKYIDQNTHLQDYMAFPRFLLETDLNDTAKLLYMILLDRVRLSATNSQWRDDKGRIFVRYSIKNLGEKLGRGKTTIETGLAFLEDHGLIRRKRTGIGRPNLIYVLLPVRYRISDVSGVHEAVPEIWASEIPETGKPDITGPENRRSQNRFSGNLMTGKLATNKNNKNKNNIVKRESKNTRLPHGRYKNVFLSEKELKTLRKEIPHPEEYIEQLSSYMKSTSCEKRYKDHAATILRWAHKDQRERQAKETLEEKDYSYKEGESL